MDNLILNALEFGGSSRILTMPTVNKENSILIEEYKDKLKTLQKIDEECTSLKRRVQFMKEHRNEVNEAIVTTITMFKSSFENCAAENSLIGIAEREINNVQKNICRMENLTEEIREKLFKLENSIFARRIEARNLQECLHIESTQLDGWMNYAEQKWDDICVIKCLYHKDDLLLKSLFVKIDQLSLEKANMKKRLDEMLINGSVQKLQMEKLSREARNDVEERMDALNLWERAVIRTQNRGEEMDALLQSVEALGRRINAKLQERKEREHRLKNAVRDTSEWTTRLEKFEKQLEGLKEKHSSLRAKMKNTFSQLKMLKIIAERSGITMSSLRSNIREAKTTISSLTEKLTATSAKIEDLKGKMEEICASKVSIDQLVIEAEHRLQEEERNVTNLTREIEGLCRSRFNISQEQKSAKNERLRTENLIRSCRSELKRLNNQIRMEEEKVTHQERTIYDQDLRILHIESRLSKLQSETSSEEIEDYQEGIQHLSTESERLSKVQRKLLTELEVLQVNSKQMERAFKKLLIEKAAVDSRRENDTAYVEQAENSIKKCKNEYNKILVEKNMLQLKIRRTDESLQFYNEKVFTLEKDRLLMENCIKEREIDINIAMEMTVTTLRLTAGENARLRKEIKFRRLQTNKLTNRYEIELLKMAQPAEGKLESQTFSAIKALQEMDELKGHGDKLDAEINQSEKELEALQNTLSLMKESNRICENNYLEAEPDLAQKRSTLEQSHRELKSAVQRKKEQLVSITAKVEELQLALDTADQELVKAQFCGNELQTSISKLEQSINILNQRILRATRCLTKAKAAALQHIQKGGDLSETEMRADIELQLKRDLNEKLVALMMSQLQSKKDQKDAEVHARAYLAAANVTTGPRSSWAPSKDITKLLSGASPTDTSCPSAATTATTPTTTTRTVIKELMRPNAPNITQINAR